jgi:nitric oxide reductase activation protein
LGPDAAEKLQACALMISEGLSECNIEHEILGYCAPYEPEFGEQKISDVFNRKSCRLETVVAKNFGDKGLAGIASLELAQADNSDGESLRVAVSRLKKRAGKKKIVFLISDGKPFMQDSDIAVLDEDLRRALIEAANQKIAVVSVGFGPNGHPVLGEAHIGIEKVSDLPAALGMRLAREE